MNMPISKRRPAKRECPAPPLAERNILRGLRSPPAPSGRSIQAKGIEPDIKILQEVPADLKARPRSAVTSRRKALKNPARSPTCRRTKRTIALSRRRSIFSAARSRMRHSRRIRKLLFAKARQRCRAAVPRQVVGRARVAPVRTLAPLTYLPLAGLAATATALLLR
jgi:hypothetical protein